MNLRKNILFILSFIFLSSLVLAQSISVSGSSTATLASGSSTKTVRYNIGYYDYGGKTLSLHYIVDEGSMVPQYRDGSWANMPSYVDIDLSEGSHTIEFILFNYDWEHLQWETADTKNKSTTVYFKVFVENIFGAGSIKINGVTKSSGDYVLVKGGDNINVEAIEQSYSSKDYVWNTSAYNTSKWQTEPYGGGGDIFSYSKSTTYNVQSDDNYTILVAELRFNCYVTFQNNLPGMDNDGVIKVNDSQVNSPSTGNIVVESNPITGTPVNQVINGIYYTFHDWDGDSTIFSKTFYPENNMIYTAYYGAKPTNTYRTLRFNDGDYGEDIELTWNAHQLDNNGITKYDIYRKVREDGVTGPEAKIGTRTANGSASYSFTDYLYQVANGTTDINCLYDVRAYYSPSSTYADPSFQSIYADCLADIKNIDIHESETAMVAAEEENSESLKTMIGNYPNPFNPTTNINYTLAKDGFVSLKIYNVLGKEVATLVNEVIPAGNYSVSFNASNLPSGVYIYTLQTNRKSLTQKMLLLR